MSVPKHSKYQAAAQGISEMRDCASGVSYGDLVSVNRACDRFLKRRGLYRYSKTEHKMKTATLALVALILACVSARADRARIKIIVAPDGKSFTWQTTEYTKNSIDEVFWTIIDSFGVTKTLYSYHGAHRGYTWADEKIGTQVYKTVGDGGGGPPSNKREGINGSVQFTVFFGSENGLVIGSGTVNIPFLSGGLHLRGSWGGGFRFHSYTPSSSAPTHSSNGIFGNGLYWWSVDTNKGASK